MSGVTPRPGTDLEAGSEVTGPGVGQRIGSYRIIRLIGQGATGRVFEVEHLTIGRRAAMKILSPEHAGRPGAIRRLFSEAQAVNKISHPHIVEVTDLVEAESPQGVNAIVMELLEGQSLAQAVAEGGRMAPVRFLPILAQVCDALAAAHGANFVHRDLKPENIYLSATHGRDYVKLLDFGLAKSINEEREPPTKARSHATAEGIFVGTPAYASPEQAAGKALDHRTDIYSIGVILYELLCGKLPFEGQNFGEYVVKHLTQPPPPAPAEVLRTPLGRALDAIARRCLSKAPQERYATASELRDLFERLASGDSPSLTATLGGASRRKKLAVVSAMAIAALSFGGVTLRKRSREQAAAERAAAAVKPIAHAPRVVPLLPAKTVVLLFDSAPAGAETRLVGSDELLGLTPFHRTESADGRTVEFEMRLPGYAPRRQRVVLAPDQGTVTIGGPLKAQSPGARAAKTKTARTGAVARGPHQTPAQAATSSAAGKPAGKTTKAVKVSRNATLNPFAARSR